MTDLLAEPEYRQMADVDTPSGNYVTRDVLSSSAAEVDVSAMNISDIHAISVVNKEPADNTMNGTLTFKCGDCGLVCKNASALS